MVLSPSKKEAGRYCCAYACRNEPIARKGGLCHKHYARRLKERDPVLDRYNNFKGNARQRGKEFSITIEEFRDFCQRTGYIIDKGKRGQNATVDRIVNARGYHIDNIQLLTNRQNASKGAKTPEEYAECPF